MRILFIHGRAQEEFTESELRENWTNALQLSFSDAGLNAISKGIEIDFVYYATDLIDMLNKYVEGPEHGSFVFRGTHAEMRKFENFQSNFINDIAANAQINKAEAQRKYGRATQERGILNNPVSVALLRALDNSLPKVANFSIKKKTDDVAAYLVVQEITNHINSIVIDKLTKEPTIIIAHSLGTIIAYNVLKEINRDRYDIRMLITLGSPLGVKSVQRQLTGQLAHPNSLKGHWHNLFDPNDYVSLNPLDGTHFNIDPSISNYPVQNESDNRHGIVHYLSNPKIATIITEFLNNSSD